MYGAAYQEDFSVSHKRVDNIKDLKTLCTSKYVQSRIENIYQLAIKDLKEGRRILFSGTPCQTEAMKRLCPSGLQDNLYLCSVACNGVTAPFLWDGYRSVMEKTYMSRITSVNMRDKKRGWHRFSMNIGFENGEEYSVIHDKDPYFRVYLSGRFHRPSCYRCNCKNILEDTDFLIADAWGYETYTSRKIDDLGKSMLCMASSKAKEILDNANITYEKYSEQIIRKTHPSIFESISPQVQLSGDVLEKIQLDSEGMKSFFDIYGKETFTDSVKLNIKLIAEKIGLIGFMRKHKA